MAKIDSKAAIKTLEKQWGDKPCPMCSGPNWTVGNTVYQLAEFHKGDVVIGGSIVPVYPVSCTTCGYTVLVNAIISGMVSNTPPDKVGGAQ